MDLETEWASARADRVRAQASLAGFFADGTGAESLVAAVPSTPTRTPLPAIEALVQRASAERGELLALQQEAESARFAARAAARRAIPEPELVAGTKSSNFAGSDIGSVFSIHATVPLFDRGSPERAMAQARLTQAETRAAAFRITLAAQIAGLRATVVERREAADRYRATSLTTATQLERIAQVSYDAGERGILELLDAYRGGAATRTRQATLDAAVRQAEIELEFVSGWELQ
jgi:cobalt-zinc-cadmium efflux system outer membrane protein